MGRDQPQDGEPVSRRKVPEHSRVYMAVATGDRNNSGASRRALDLEALALFACRVAEFHGVEASVRCGRHVMLIDAPRFPDEEIHRIQDRVVDYVDIQRAMSREGAADAASKLWDRYISEFPDGGVKVGAGFILAHLERMIMRYDMWEGQ